MATARKLKSGNYRCLVYDYTDENGKRIYKSFTASTKRKAEYLASNYKMQIETYSPRTKADMTLGSATDLYLLNRQAVLSPYTMHAYHGIARNHISKIGNIRLDRLTQESVQAFINAEASIAIRNIHGLLSAVLAIYKPDFTLRTNLPQKIIPKLNIPNDEDIKTLLELAKGTELEIPIMLASFGLMRRGEICALSADDVEGNIIHIHSAMVRLDDGSHATKAPKTTASDRYVELPSFVIDKLPKEGKLTKLTPNQLTSRFLKLVKKSGLKSFRFHDLRHYSASVLHALNVPDKYIMERGGWSTSSTLKNVYQHTMRGKQKEINEKINRYFNDFN